MLMDFILYILKCHCMLDGTGVIVVTLGMKFWKSTRKGSQQSRL